MYEVCFSFFFFFPFSALFSHSKQGILFNALLGNKSGCSLVIYSYVRCTYMFMGMYKYSFLCSHLLAYINLPSQNHFVAFNRKCFQYLGQFRMFPVHYTRFISIKLSTYRQIFGVYRALLFSHANIYSITRHSYKPTEYTFCWWQPPSSLKHFIDMLLLLLQNKLKTR